MMEYLDLKKKLMSVEGAVLPVASAYEFHVQLITPLQMVL